MPQRRRELTPAEDAWLRKAWADRAVPVKHILLHLKLSNPTLRRLQIDLALGAKAGTYGHRVTRVRDRKAPVVEAAPAPAVVSPEHMARLRRLAPYDPLFGEVLAKLEAQRSAAS